jgi:hypothetical protein
MRNYQGRGKRYQSSPDRAEAEADNASARP